MGKEPTELEPTVKVTGPQLLILVSELERAFSIFLIIAIDTIETYGCIVCILSALRNLFQSIKDVKT